MRKKTETKYYKYFIKLGNNVQNERINQNLTIKQLSEMTKIREEYLNKIEEGTAYGISTKHLFKIARVLNVNPVELVKH